jgi:nucleotide-binding universal stress UspA family protein
MAEHLTLADDKVSLTFLVGDPTSELLRFVVETKSDLVVMGIKNRDIRHVFAGSVAERMFRKCPVPIVSYRGDDIAERLRKRVYKHIIDHH